MKHHAPFTKLVLAVAVLGTFCAAARAQLFSETFDPLPGGSPVTWSFGTLGNVSVSYVAGAGMGGSGAAVIAADYQAQWNGGVAYQYQNGNVLGATSPNRSDYTLSFDMGVTGLALNNLQLNVQAWPGTGWSGTMTESSAGALTVSPVTGWQHVAVNLGNTSIWPSNGLNPAGGTIHFQFQVNGWQLAGGGPSVGQKVAIDNITLTMVPEPSTVTLLGLGGVALLIRRRR